jgi:hypothetical protein
MGFTLKALFEYPSCRRFLENLSKTAARETAPDLSRWQFLDRNRKRSDPLESLVFAFPLTATFHYTQENGGLKP